METSNPLLGPSETTGVKKAIFINENQRLHVRVSGILAILHIIIGLSYIVITFLNNSPGYFNYMASYKYYRLDHAST